MIRALLLLLLITLPGRAAERPNILLILADDLGVGDVAALYPGRGKIPTPHLDRLAAQGLNFTDAHSGAAVCTPTRYGLLTGRAAWRTRLQRGVLDGANDPPLIAADRLTLPAFLRTHGYATAMVGKWHLGYSELPPAGAKDSAKGAEMGRGGPPVGTVIPDGPVTRGFDTFWGCSNARTMSSLVEQDRVTEILAPVDVLPRLARRAVSDIERLAADPAKPFFLYVALTSPHTPILPAPEWKGKSGLGDYGDFVMQTDAVVGDLLAALDRSGRAANTLVVFSADNGCSPQAGVAKLEKAGHFPSGPFRGYKSDLWEGGHRVPLLARWPGRIAPGTRSERVVCLTDLFATAAALLEHPVPAGAAEDSESFLPALLGRPGAPPRGPLVHHSIEGRFALRDGRWKLALCAGSGGWSKGKEDNPQLYDLAADPGETRNLAQAHPDEVRRLRASLEAIVHRAPNDAPVVVERK